MPDFGDGISIARILVNVLLAAQLRAKHMVSAVLPWTAMTARTG
jgi:hypothetical protein